MKEQKGIALITVVIATALVVILIGASILIARTETSTSQTGIVSEQAFSAAEAGIDWAAAKIRNAADFATTTTTYFSVGNATVGVKITNAYDPTTRTGTAVIYAYSVLPPYAGTPTSMRAIIATYRTEVSIISGWTMFERAITANGQIYAKNNAEIRVASQLPNNDNISVLSNYSGPGDAISIGKLDYLDGKVGIMSGETVSGIPTGKWTYASPDPVPTLTSTSPEILAFKQEAINQGHYYGTDQNWGSGITLSDGIYFIEGNLTVDNKLSGRGTIVVTGNFTSKNKTEISSDSLALIVLGDAEIDLKNKATINGYIYAAGNLEFKNSATIVGGISCAGSLNFWNNLEITYQDLGESTVYLPSGFSRRFTNLILQSWSETAPPTSP
jgi:Tfp pilus assembly protein PilV